MTNLDHVNGTNTIDKKPKTNPTNKDTKAEDVSRVHTTRPRRRMRWTRDKYIHHVVIVQNHKARDQHHGIQEEDTSRIHNKITRCK